MLSKGTRREGKLKYKKWYTQLAPELVDGLVPQCVAPDIFSIGVLAEKVILHAHSSTPKLLNIFKPCTNYHSAERPTIDYLLSSYCIV